MLIDRTKLPYLMDIIAKNAQKHFNIQTQYKFLKLKQAIEKEDEIYREQIILLRDYCEVDENGEYIRDQQGGIKIKEDKKVECNQLLNEINQVQIQLPDIYFSLDELEPLELTLNELELLSIFLK